MLMSLFILVTIICYIHKTSISYSNRFQQVESPIFDTFFYNTVCVSSQTVFIFLKNKAFFPFSEKGYNKERTLEKS